MSQPMIADADVPDHMLDAHIAGSTFLGIGLKDIVAWHDEFHDKGADHDHKPITVRPAPVAGPRLYHPMQIILALAVKHGDCVLTADDLTDQDHVITVTPTADGGLTLVVLTAPTVHPTMGTASTSPNPPKEQKP